MHLKEILAYPTPSAADLGSTTVQFHVPGLKNTSPHLSHTEVQFTPLELLKASLPHITPSDRTDILAALGISIDEVSGEVLIETASGEKRLLLGYPA
jgi:hypothetical protein